MEAYVPRGRPSCCLLVMSSAAVNKSAMAHVSSLRGLFCAGCVDGGAGEMEAEHIHHRGHTDVGGGVAEQRLGFASVLFISNAFMKFLTEEVFKCLAVMSWQCRRVCGACASF